MLKHMLKRTRKRGYEFSVVYELRIAFGLKNDIERLFGLLFLVKEICSSIPNVEDIAVLQMSGLPDKASLDMWLNQTSMTDGGAGQRFSGQGC